MQTAHELFLHELGDMLDAEKKLVEALGEQAEESSRPEVKKAFEMHQKQTEGQVERLQQVFEELGESPDESECKGIKGLKEEHDAFKEEDPSEDLLDIFNVGAAKKVEKYEITAYESLIELAGQMGHTRASKLLNQNLREEQQTLKRMEALGKKLKPERMGMEEEEGQAREEMERASQRRPSRSSRSSSRSRSSRGRRSAA
jgi:ferritin-like metal-binding protein YciE